MVTLFDIDFAVSSDCAEFVFFSQYPLFLELFVEALFTSKGAKINPDHKHKYIYLLAYAASVTEAWNKVTSQSIAMSLN